MSLDYRLIENRKAAFVEWMRWSIENNDCDPSLYMTNYLFDRFEHNLEQKLWICWLYGTTYYLPTSWVVFNEFPDAELVDLGRLTEWNTHNYKRLRYQTDTKYNKGFLPQQFESYKNWALKNGNQVDHFRSLIADNPQKTYLRLTEEVTKNLYKFGRYTTWFYLQTLKHCAGIPMEPPSLLLADRSGSRSHRNGLCYALGKDEWVDAQLTVGEVQWLEDAATELLSSVKAALPASLAFKADRFAMETCLCSFKKLFRVSRGRYLGYYLDRQAEEISTVEADGWEGIYWKPLWDARNETIDTQLLCSRIDEGRMSQFLETGTIDRAEYNSATLESLFS